MKPPPHRTHRHRYSLTHLSSDTTATLPEYAPSSAAWQQHHAHIQQDGRAGGLELELEGTLSDRPPDYPDSADEADEETDSISSETAAYAVPLAPPPPPPVPPHPAPPHRHPIKRFSSSISPSNKAHVYHTNTHNNNQHYNQHQRYQQQQQQQQQQQNYSHRPHLQPRRYRSATILPSPTDDPYLDSLLERSVHALEMSNTLLQSSISTRTSLSALLTAPATPVDGMLEESARGLTSRMRVDGQRREAWVDNLEEIKKDVEELFMGEGEGGNDGEATSLSEREGGEEESEANGTAREEGIVAEEEHGQWAVVSSSLPTSSSMPGRCAYKRRPSQLDLQGSNDVSAASISNIPRLTYSPHHRSRLVAPAPRAITQYIASSANPESIVLPSTLGMRSQSSIVLPHASASSSLSSLSLHTSPLAPKVTDRRPEPATPAYHMLASFMHRRTPTSSSSTPSSLSTPSRLASFMTSRTRRRASSSASPAASNNAGGESTETVPSAASAGKRWPSIDGSRTEVTSTSTMTVSSSHSHPQTPKRTLSPLIHRPMTPPTEESASASSLSSSSDSLVAKRTVMSLRKILDEQAQTSARLGISASAVTLGHQKPLRAPAFMPRTPAPMAQASTSNATASISRLFTKAIHTSSTRPPSPPRQSAMKHGSGSRNPVSSIAGISVSSLSTNGVAVSSNEASTSIASTSSTMVNGNNANSDSNGTTSNGTASHLGLLPELLSAGVARAFGGARMLVSNANGTATNSASSSGWSTPKRISFAELPPSTRLEGQPSKFRERQQQRKRRKGTAGRENRSWDARTENVDDLGIGPSGLVDGWEVGSPGLAGGWWPEWLAGAGGMSGMAGLGGGGSGGMYVTRYEERMEDRMNRSWGSTVRMASAPGYGGGLDDWAV
ncbi:hypothetical protein AX17_002152 [Amanita inopinata Kibby_2008]|nr:hypothetical protein AX17_002152 [Amanita inopinata Kibby_2008]